MRTAYGVPVVDSAATLPQAVTELGIVPWERSRPEPMDLDRYRAILDGGVGSLLRMRREEIERFAPKIEVLHLVSPDCAKDGVYFRSVGKNWVTVFATVPDPGPGLFDVVKDKWWNQLVPIVAEWKHGAEVIVIGPPCGSLEEGESPRDCAMREFLDETGFELADVEPLVPSGLAVSARQSTQQYLPCFGTVKEPITRGEVKLDKTEHLKLMFVRLVAWVDFVLSGAARDDNAYVTTFLALHKMGLLRVGLKSGSGLQI